MCLRMCREYVCRQTNKQKEKNIRKGNRQGQMNTVDFFNCKITYGIYNSKGIGHLQTRKNDMN